MNSVPRDCKSGSNNQTGKKIKNYLYQYSDMIGSGNFAKVYKGTDMNSEKTVAIKMISLDQLKSRHLEQLVFEEIRILQLLRHPNILSFIQALLSQRHCYIVTELCREGNLDDRIKRRTGLCEAQIGRIILDLWRGLKYMREKGVAHRDLKPANIFFQKGRAVIADFGLAKFYRQRFKDLDIGSPQYMSPEGIILNCYSQKTDIWSLGIIIYQILHGETPFIFCKLQNDLKYHLSRPIPEQRWRKDVNPLLRQFVNRCLQVDENKRPNIFELAQEPYLRQLLQRQKEKQGSRIIVNQLTVNHNIEDSSSKKSTQKKEAQQQARQVKVQTVNQEVHQSKFYSKSIPTEPYPCERSLSSGGKKFNFRKELKNSPGSIAQSQNYSQHSSFSKQKSQKLVVTQMKIGNSMGLINQKITFQVGPTRSGKELSHNQKNINTPPPKTNIYHYTPIHRKTPEMVRRQICEKTSETNESEDDRWPKNIPLQNGRFY